MSAMELPYTTEARPDTGVYNAKLGMWLFLASEVMLFGGLFSAYMFLRMGVVDWPRGSDLLHVNMAAINTVILVVSGITMAMSWASLKTDAPGKSRMYLALTILLGAAFLVIKGIEYNDKFSAGIYPKTNTFYAIYFVLTGVHFLHIVGGLVVMSYHLLFGWILARRNPEQYENRIEVTGLYWHFVDLVWIVLFPTLYLI